MEIWRSVPSVPSLEASSEGLIRCVTFIGKMPYGGNRQYRGKAWTGAWNGKRYTTHFRGRNYKVARLICEAFHGPAPADRPYCLHIDENARNNKPSNLKWGTQRENLNAPGFLDYCRSRTGENSPTTKARAKRA